MSTGPEFGSCRGLASSHFHKGNQALLSQSGPN